MSNEKDPRNDPISYEMVPDGFLGQGLARVDKVKYKPDGKIFARKRYPIPENNDQREIFDNEIANEKKIMTGVAHYQGDENNLIFPRLHGSYEEWETTSQNTLNLIISPVARCNLAMELFSIRASFDPTIPQVPPPNKEKQTAYRHQTMIWVHSLTEALIVLHDFNVIRHRDIKLDNVLAVDPEADAKVRKKLYSVELLLSDFGISKLFNEASQSATNRSDLATSQQFNDESQSVTNTARPEQSFFSAPEVAGENGSHGKPSDVFSIGCLFFEIFAVLWNIPQLKEHTKTWGSSERYADKVRPFGEGQPRGSSQMETLIASALGPEATWIQELPNTPDRANAKFLLTLIGRILRHEVSERPHVEEIYHLVHSKVNFSWTALV